uniref:Cog4 domain-containing protein n=1 Tax=Glossina pallidipes TaxID=7398 RepID=A0A1B0A942_GLOPL
MECWQLVASKLDYVAGDIVFANSPSLGHYRKASGGSTDKLNPKDLDAIIAETTLMHSRAELYFHFMKRRVTVNNYKYGGAHTCSCMLRMFRSGRTSLIPSFKRLSIKLTSRAAVMPLPKQIAVNRSEAKVVLISALKLARNSCIVFKKVSVLPSSAASSKIKASSSTCKTVTEQRKRLKSP